MRLRVIEERLSSRIGFTCHTRRLVTHDTQSVEWSEGLIA